MNKNENISKNKRIIPLILIAATLLLSSAGLAGATELSYTDVTCLNTGSEVCSSTLYVYYSNDTLAGSLNSSTGTINVDPGASLHLFLKPNSVSLLSNPTFAIQWMISSWGMFFTILFMFSMLISMFYIIKRLFMGNGGTASTPGSSGSQAWSKRRWG